MPDDATPPSGKPAFATRMTHAARAPVRSHGFVNLPVHRGSTVLAPSCEDRRQNAKRRFERVMTYGTQGGPTHYALEDVIAEIEGGTHCTIVGTGLAAVAVPLLAFLKAGDRCLMPDSAYGPARNLAEGLMAGWGIETAFYDPCIDAAGLEALWTPNTRVLYLESPGSHTFEVQDVPALTAVARRHGAVSMIDNTWGIHHFQPFAQGCDVSIQALTKYVGGHSDILLGSSPWRRGAPPGVRGAASAMGTMPAPMIAGWRCAARGPWRCGWPTRKRRRSRSRAGSRPGRRSRASCTRPCPRTPATRSGSATSPGRAACSAWCSSRATRGRHLPLVDGLQLFGIGASWGGYESLALPTNGMLVRRVTDPLQGQAVRLHVGLEAVPDLLADLDQGLARLPG
jgi:cystathionine beta-lyase